MRVVAEQRGGGRFPSHPFTKYVKGWGTRPGGRGVRPCVVRVSAGGAPAPQGFYSFVCSAEFLAYLSKMLGLLL